MLPPTAESTLDWYWSHYAPFVQDLLSRKLTDQTIVQWLSDWTALFEVVNETNNRLWLATAQDTNDSAAQERYARFRDEVFVQWEQAEQSLRQKWLQSGQVIAGMEVPFKRLQIAADHYSEANAALNHAESTFDREFSQIAGAWSVEWESDTVSLSKLKKMTQTHPDRDLRERAWRLAAQRQLQDRDALNTLWLRAYTIRQETAIKAGYSDYQAYKWQELGRVDYTLEDCLQFCEIAETSIAPVLARHRERLRSQLSIERIRPWDIDTANVALTAFATPDELVTILAGIFRQMHPQLSRWYEVMSEENLLDTEPRPRKIGGHMTELRRVKRPYVLVNANGSNHDVRTFVHEIGHAFHAFATYDLPFYQQRDVPMEFKEFASQVMEWLTLPYLHRDRGGFYDDQEWQQAVQSQILWVLWVWLMVAQVVRFQHEVYTNLSPGSDIAACDTLWWDLENRLQPGINRDGLEEFFSSGWQRVEHILTLPFYAIEYAFAQFGALQLWSRSQADEQGAFDNYLQALSLGATVSVPELYRAAGTQFAFVETTIQPIIEAIARQLQQPLS